MTDQPAKPIKIEDADAGDAPKSGGFYCRIFKYVHDNPYDCSGNVSSEDACAQWAINQGCAAYSWTYKPCGQ